MKMFERKSIPMNAGLMIITCGIYNHFWVYNLSSELYELSEEEGSPGLDVAFGIITCGLYYIYLNYKWGKKMEIIERKYLGNCYDEPSTYLFLSLFGLNIVSESIIQSKLNNQIYDLANANKTSNVNQGPDNYSKSFDNYDQISNDNQNLNNINDDIQNSNDINDNQNLNNINDDIQNPNDINDNKNLNNINDDTQNPNDINDNKNPSDDLK